MNDYTERPEDTVKRFAKQIQELLAWQAKYRLAAELWDGFELGENDQVTEAVAVARIADFTRGGMSAGISATGGCDWIIQLGLFHAGLRIMGEGELHQKGEDDG